MAETFWLAVILMLVLGLRDDLEPLSPYLKLIWQYVIALILCGTGWRLQWFDSLSLNYVVTILWIVGITNAFNMMDNMDGLSPSIGATIALFVFFITGYTPSLILVGILGIVLAFNWYPRMIMLHNYGSYSIGLVIALLTMHPKIGIVAPILCLPLIADTTYVTVRRMATGISPFQGGKDHLSHWLEKHFSTTIAVTILWFFSVISGIGALILTL